MPDKPLWLSRIPRAVEQLQSLTDRWVDRALLESLLGIGRRRAQQILSGVASRRAGSSLLADREDLVVYLNRIAAGEESFYEQGRRRKLWGELAEIRRQWLDQPPILVDMPSETVRDIRRRDFAGLPAGVSLEPGRITLEFSTPEEALQKLMALAVAISRNRAAFDERVTSPPPPRGPF